MNALIHACKHIYVLVYNVRIVKRSLRKATCCCVRLCEIIAAAPPRQNSVHFYLCLVCVCLLNRKSNENLRKFTSKYQNSKQSSSRPPTEFINYIWNLLAPDVLASPSLLPPRATSCRRHRAACVYTRNESQKINMMQN